MGDRHALYRYAEDRDQLVAHELGVDENPARTSEQLREAALQPTEAAGRMELRVVQPGQVMDGGDDGDVITQGDVVRFVIQLDRVPTQTMLERQPSRQLEKLTLERDRGDGSQCSSTGG